VLALGFLGVMAYVAYRDGTIPQTLLLVFEIIASYVIGYVFSVILLRRARAGKGLSRRAAVARNVISIAAIGITAGVCWAIVAERFDLVPDYLENGLAWTVAFYFGSRLVA
jgi:predicted permease